MQLIDFSGMGFFALSDHDIDMEVGDSIDDITNAIEQAWRDRRRSIMQFLTGGLDKDATPARSKGGVLSNG